MTTTPSDPTRIEWNKPITEWTFAEAMARWQAAVAALDRYSYEELQTKRTEGKTRRGLMLREATIRIEGLPGKNDAERSAHFLLLCRDDSQHQALSISLAEAEALHDEAARRVKVADARIRLCRGMLRTFDMQGGA